MGKIKTAILTHNNPGEEMLKNGESELKKLLGEVPFELTGKNPELFYFISGGSEKNAAALLENGNYYILVGSKHNNSFASAYEVAAYASERGIKFKLLDKEKGETKIFLEKYFGIKRGIENLKGKKLGLIGEISEWLISSGMDENILFNKLGITIKQIPWNTLKNFKEVKPSESLLNFYKEGVDINLIETAQVYQLLESVIEQEKLDAITVECFSLVKENSVTACLALALFNNKLIPAGCEGDTTTAIGMMLCREILNKIPWIANINQINNESAIFSHCTIDPALVEDAEITTHFETGKGTAIKGKFKAREVTILRIKNDISKVFIATGEVIDTPHLTTACRTQIEVRLPGDVISKLNNSPLGNHHIILSGNYSEELRLAFEILNVNVI